MKNLTFFLLLLVLLSGTSIGCSHTTSNASQIHIQETARFEEALQSAASSFPTGCTPTITSTITPSLTRQIPTNTPTEVPSNTPTATISTTPPPLPDQFISTSLAPGVDPYTYIDEHCKYLLDRWGNDKSPPGTVVMPIMYHSITGDNKDLSPDGSQIHERDLDQTINKAVEAGFETITTEELVNFLYKNAKIPKRSLILILDDRRPGVARVTFFPYLEKHDWTLTLSWLIGDTDQKSATYLPQYPDEIFSSLWEQMETYYAMGYYDIQAHGFVHNVPITEESTDEYIYHEVVDSRKVLQDHFYCKDHETGLIIEPCNTEQPLAYVWSGGGFSKRAVEIAREAEYKVGFTVNPRGPIMFNWVPLAAERSPEMPSWLPEAYIDDPLMTLPRYWSSDAAYHIDEVIQISEEAEVFAYENQEIELAYYQAICESEYGPINSGQ